MKKILFTVLIFSIITIGCSDKNSAGEINNGEPVFSNEADGSIKVKDMEDLSNKAINRLTGEYVKEEIANQRPIAVVINNIKRALPQSGIKQADLYYEVLAEGNITRIIAIFQDYDMSKIGPVRSARHYFLDFALDNDALFIHHGGSPTAYSSIRSLRINNLDGMNDTTSFFRDQIRLNTAGMYEHSSYVNGQNLKQNLQSKRYRTERFEDYVSSYNFYPVITTPVGYMPANNITIPFSDAYISVFKYDEESRLYFKFNGNDEHIDIQTNEQLAVTNILVQNVDMYVIPGDDEGRREVNLIGKGEGYLITNGAYVPVNWVKRSHDEPTEWFSQNGTKLRLNTGKTWICVLNSSPIIE